MGELLGTEEQRIGLNYPKMYLVCGISGSGKTTFSTAFAEEHNMLRICPDDIYAMFNGTETNRSHAFEVWQTLYLIIHTAEKDGRDIVVDSNALTISQRDQFVEWFPRFEHHLILIWANKELRRKNNLSRNRKVPETTMDYMETVYQKPNKKTDGNWETITYIKNENNKAFVPNAIT